LKARSPGRREVGTPGKTRLVAFTCGHLQSPGCTVYAPVPKPKDPNVDRFAPKPGDSAAVAAWRQRMATDQAKVIYKDRAATAECINALARGRGLMRLLVRGSAKVKAIALWYALVHNLLRAAHLRAAAAGPG